MCIYSTRKQEQRFLYPYLVSSCQSALGGQQVQHRYSLVHLTTRYYLRPTNSWHCASPRWVIASAFRRGANEFMSDVHSAVDGESTREHRRSSLSPSSSSLSVVVVIAVVLAAAAAAAVHQCCFHVMAYRQTPYVIISKANYKLSFRWRRDDMPWPVWPLLAAALTATPTSGFDFQHGISYWCSAVTIAIKCVRNALSWGHVNRQTDRQTDESQHCLMSPMSGKHNK